MKMMCSPLMVNSEDGQWGTLLTLPVEMSFSYIRLSNKYQNQCQTLREIIL